MTPQHRQAVEIMSECGMSAHEIVSAFGSEGVLVALTEVQPIVEKDKKPIILTPMQERILSTLSPGCYYFTDDFAFCHIETARAAFHAMLELGIVSSAFVYDLKTKRSKLGFRLKEAA